MTVFPAIRLPEPVQTALQRLNAAGSAAYIVGGCVRDALRGCAPHDWDCTTDARPAQIAACFSGYHVIETGIQHGTVTVVIDRMPIEITTFRIDGVYADHRRPESVTFTDSLEADLSRRDFTVNAMAYHPDRGVIDPFGGADDLAAKRIVCVGDPNARFQEDGLRILRALRFASVLDFAIDGRTAGAVREMRALLREISAERIYAELTKLLCGQAEERILTEFPEVIFTVLPRLAPMHGFDQRNPHHDYDVWTHTLKTVSAAPAEPVLRWAALLHDTGKPHSFTFDGQCGHFYRHAAISEEIAAASMHEMKCDRKTYDRVRLLVRLHDTVWSGKDRQLKAAVSKYGQEAVMQLLQLHRADVSAQAEQLRAARIAEADALIARLGALAQENACMSLKQLAVSGSDLIGIGCPQGPQIGRMLNALLEAVMDGSLVNTREALLRAAAEQLGQPPEKVSLRDD